MSTHPRERPTRPQGARSVANHFIALNYPIAVALCLPFVRALSLEGLAALYALTLLATYPALYLIPSWLLTWLAGWTASRMTWVPRGAVGAVAVLTATATAALLLLDSNTHELYGFHLNGFVWNLVTTRGGLASLGLSTSAVVTASLGLGLLLAAQWGLWRLATRLSRSELPRIRLRTALTVLLLLSLVERLSFGLADLNRSGPVLAAAKSFPLYNGSTFQRLAAKLGVEVQPRTSADLGGNGGALVYPLSELEIVPPDRPLNIVWLVAESWRWDALDAEIMPATAAFAERAQRFTNHYSGGNGTRMGMFSMFYGLYAPYWFPVLDANRGPVLIDAIQAQDYQTRMFTSAHFTYPEFDRTIFARIPSEQLIEAEHGRGWERDRRNVDELLEFVEQRDPSRPFMTFLFFESPHARYYFPPESVIREPYLEDFNYATMNLERDIELIHNRYLNSCRHLDSQFARVLDYLEREQLLANTLVILTGDHGEEFLEKGRWGHGSTFVEEQVRVPLVLWIPGQPPRQVERMTSHLDLPATLLPLLGVLNPEEELSHGHDLAGSRERAHTVIGDWSGICYVDDECKLMLPMMVGGLLRSQASYRDDSPLPAGMDPMASRTQALADLLEDLARFR